MSGIERLISNILNIVDPADCRDGKVAETAGNDQGLVFAVADDADAGFPAELDDVVIKFGSELRVGDIVNPAVEFAGSVRDRQPAAPGSEMRMIICSVKKIANAIVCRSNTEKTTHNIP